MEEPMAMGSPQSPIRSQKTYMTEYLLGSGGTPKFAAPSPVSTMRKPHSNHLLNISQTANSPLFVSSPNVSSRATDLKTAGLQSQTPQSNVNSPRFLDTERSVRFDSSSPWTGSGTTPQHSDKLRSRFAMVEQPKPSGPPIAAYSSPRVGQEDSRLHRSFTTASLLDQSHSNSFSHDISRNTTASRDPKIPSYLSADQSLGDLDSSVGRNNSSGANEIDLWVTVFGFPPAAAKHVLQDFAVTSTICDHRLCNESNWMHLKFSNRIEVSKALTKSGKIIGKSMMIGVVPCIDSSVLLTESEAWQRQNQSNKSKSFTEAAAVATSNSSVLNNSRQIAINSPLCEKKSILNETVVPMESNNAAFSQGGGLRPVTKSSVGTPTLIGDNPGYKGYENHSQSVLSKAVEYFFGS